MNRRELIRTAGWCTLGAILNLHTPSPASAQPDLKDFEEYCFEISPHETIGMREITTTPKQFLRQNPGVEAAINGPQFRNNTNMGVAYLSKNHVYGNQDPGDIRAYFSVATDGRVQVSPDLEGKIKGLYTPESMKCMQDYWFVLGARPPLVINREIPPEALHPGYKEKDYRSAIGTKGHNNISFAVSAQKILIKEWARILRDAGYQGALNLDGGPKSMLAIRTGNNIEVKGYGHEPTRLIIFSYQH